MEGTESPTARDRFSPLTGEPADRFIATSTAGPGAGGKGSVFFAMGNHRVKFAINPRSSIEIAHRGGGVADLYYRDQQATRLALNRGFTPRIRHLLRLPAPAYSGAVLSGPGCSGRRKTIGEIIDLVESVRHRVTAISLTSGVLGSIEEEEAYVCEMIRHLRFFGLPLGVSIYPTDQTPDRLEALAVAEVKFNIEAATPALFAQMCPGLDYDRLWRVLDRSVELFGRGRVFSNVIIGLGETDAEMEACIGRLTSHGVIPVLRPLNPVAGLAGSPRPSAERLRKLFAIHREALVREGLDTAGAVTMCTNCAGCDLVPGRDE